jgi:hypothetical protein
VAGFSQYPGREIMMTRSMSALLALGVAIGCSDHSAQSPEQLSTRTPSAEAFAGTWRSVTPSLEFIRLTISPLSREQGALGLRLTFSGVAWDGSGRIEGDSLVANMAVAGTTEAIGKLVARVRDGHTLQLDARPALASSFALTLVRDN